MKRAQDNVSYIVSILKGDKPSIVPNWFEAIGFLFCNKIAGLFYNKAKILGIDMPKKIEFILRDIFNKQARSVACKREFIKEISNVLGDCDAKYAFLKGSVLSNSQFDVKQIYVDGERVSNDIDILVLPSNITAVGNALRNMGFVQGRFDYKCKEIIEFSRTEIIKRRMTRGEVAPFVKLTGNPEFPFIEIDLNFSLGNTPNDKQDLLQAILDSTKYDGGKVGLYKPSNEMFFIHLIMHQYKESCLYFMVQRSKELDIYKLADIYYMLKNNVVDLNILDGIVKQYDIAERVGAVLQQVGDVFEDTRILEIAREYGGKQPLVIDYENKRQFAWQASISERIRAFSALELLKEVSQC
ncbi:MAG: nucleotidyltransferase family protein [Clostridiales bacterium]|nr:nucleotidyltransferase family protein [Clostridiales bacterium]